VLDFNEGRDIYMSAIYGIEKFYARKENYHAIESDVTENFD
jgi:hypothetical protein